MDSLTLQPTTSTPEVRFDATSGLLVLRGESYPENSLAFYGPILKWVEEFLDASAVPVKVELGLTYLNTSSIKSLMDLLDLLEEAHKSDRFNLKNNYFTSSDGVLLAPREVPQISSVEGRLHTATEYHHDGTLAARENNQAFPDHERRRHDHGKV